jgi:hypothetical protein
MRKKSSEVLRALARYENTLSLLIFANEVKAASLPFRQTPAW